MKFYERKMKLFSYPSILTCVVGAQKNRLIETVLLSTHNICFGSEIKKIVFQYALLSGELSKAVQNIVSFNSLPTG